MKLNVQLFFKSIFQLKQSNKAQVFDKRMKIYRSMASVNAKKRKKTTKTPKYIDIHNYVTYIKSILYYYTTVTTHVTIITNDELIKKNLHTYNCQVSSNQIYNNWIPFIIPKKNKSNIF